MPIFSLSIHADYGCRHSGACCSTPWDVPVQAPIHRTIAEAIAAGRLHADRPFLTEPTPPEGASAVLRRDGLGACVFVDHDSHLCAVHRTLGEAALPSTCRIFPRIALTDRRGTFITLSHFCPTAASMLFRDDVPLAIVESPRAFPSGDYEGLNASGELPPVLHVRMLMDVEGYGAWERHAVGILARAPTPESALATISRDGHRLLEWKPGGASLSEAIAALDTGLVAVAPSRWGDYSRVVNRYLAAHAFASWMAYQGRGLRSWIRSLDATLDVLAAECAKHCEQAGRSLSEASLAASIRSADFFLRHLADRKALARIWSESEHRGGVQ